jgi:probable DNA metabolism protein
VNTSPVTRRLARGSDFAAWQALAAAALRERRAPETLIWQIGEGVDDLFAAVAPDATPGAAASVELAAAGPGPDLPAPFRQLARRVICHRDPRRHAVLYRLWWRLQREPRLLDAAADPDVRQLHAWEREVSRAAHKMKAFVRFRETEDGRYVAWFDPGHPLLEALAPFFARRFASMRWLIVTPAASCAWDGSQLRFGPGAPRGAAEGTPDDPCEQLWRTYYANIFNPARLKVNAMVREMPRRYWRDLPEAPLIPALIARAQPRSGAMVEQANARARCPGSPRPAARSRTWRRASPTVAPAPPDARARAPWPAKAPQTRGSCSSASSRATSRSAPAGRSSGPPGACSTRRSGALVSTAARSTSRMRSSISASASAAPCACTRAHADRHRALPLVGAARDRADRAAGRGRARAHRGHGAWRHADLAPGRRAAPSGRGGTRADAGRAGRGAGRGSRTGSAHLASTARGSNLGKV